MSLGKMPDKNMLLHTCTKLAASAIFVMGGTDGIVHNNEGQVLRRQALCCDNEVSYQRSDIAAYVMSKSLETQTPRHYVST